MAREPLWFDMYGDPPLTADAETLRDYVRALRLMTVPAGHPQADDIRADIDAAERRLREIELEHDATAGPAAA